MTTEDDEGSYVYRELVLNPTVSRDWFLPREDIKDQGTLLQVVSASIVV